jgi:GNAT superfamily N-acetyltransferase
MPHLASNKPIVDKVTLREARRGDEKDLWRVHVQALHATVSPEDIQANIAEFCPEPMADVSALKDSIVTVAELEGQIVGFAALNVETGWIFFMFVAPPFMRQGIGKRLLTHLEGVAVDRGIQELTLSSSVYAHAFYRACGYVGDERIEETGWRTGLVSKGYKMRKVIRTT